MCIQTTLLEKVIQRRRMLMFWIYKERMTPDRIATMQDSKGKETKADEEYAR